MHASCSYVIMLWVAIQGSKVTSEGIPPSPLKPFYICVFEIFAATAPASSVALLAVFAAGWLGALLPSFQSPVVQVAPVAPLHPGPELELAQRVLCAPCPPAPVPLPCPDWTVGSVVALVVAVICGFLCGACCVGCGCAGFLSFRTPNRLTLSGRDPRQIQW